MKPVGLLLAGLACIAAPATAAPPQPVTIVAHRGLSEGVPENTLAAFRRSIDGGVAIIELDLRVTKDGRLVVVHDASLDRTTNCTGQVAAMELAQIRACDAGKGERVPTFAEVLALIRDRPVRILADVKAGTPLEPVLSAIRGHPAGSKIILGMRSPKQVTRARAALPTTTILAFIPAASDAPDFATAGANIIRLWSDWAETEPALIARIHALGPEVWITIGRSLPGKPDEWHALHKRMIAAGAQGLITDRPDLAVAQ